MTLEQLRIFVAVAERAHMTQAAAALNMTQSAVSAAIRALETGVGQHLFDRIGRRIELTESGRVLLPEAKAVLRRLSQAQEALADLNGMARGHLSLWASQTISGYWLPRFLASFRSLHPQITLDLTIGNTAQVAKAVLAGDADLGFVEGGIEDPLLVPIRVSTDKMVLVVAPGHPWAAKEGLSIDDLTGSVWVLRERGSGTRQIFEDALRKQRFDPARLTVTLELPSNEAVRAAVEAGAGATVISQLVAGTSIAAGTLTAPPFPMPDRSFTALRHADRHRSRAEIALMEMIKSADS